MQMSEVFSINRVFFRKLHHPPCCLSNFPDYGCHYDCQFHEDDSDTRSQSQNEAEPTRPFLQGTTVGFRHKTSSLKHQQRSDKMVSFCEYEIYLLFLLLIKFHGSGKCEIYSPVQRIFQCFLPCAILNFEPNTPTLYF